jgi:hypothetical protein
VGSVGSAHADAPGPGDQGRGLLAAGRDIARAIWDARALPRTTRRVLALWVLAIMAPPAGVDATVTPHGAELRESASCSQGDIEIVYSATGVDRQITRFSAEDGRDLQKYDVRVYSTHHEDREYILSQTTQPPSAGPIIAVHVTYLDAAAAAITAPRARTGHTPPASWAAQNDKARNRCWPQGINASLGRVFVMVSSSRGFVEGVR